MPKMDINKLRLFKNEQDVRHHAQNNGYGSDEDLLVSQWKEATSEVREIKKGFKKFGVLSSNDYSSKN